MSDFILKLIVFAAATILIFTFVDPSKLDAPKRDRQPGLAAPAIVGDEAASQCYDLAEGAVDAGAIDGASRVQVGVVALRVAWECEGERLK